MKFVRLQIFAALLSSAAILGGCANLDENPEGLLTPDSFYNNSNDLKAGVVAAYRPFMEYYLNAQGSLPTLGGDDVTSKTGGNKEPFRGFDRFAANPSYEWLKQHSWDPLFRTIFHANAVINNYEKVEESFARDAIAAEAYFLRGWSYFMLVRIFGPVPIVTGDATGEEPRNPESEVYELIMSDLTFAADKLPSSWFGEPGRVNKWAAKLLLSKAYLTTAGWPLKQTGNYAQAASLAKEVIDDSPFDLLANYEDLWLESNDNNRESVFAVQACADCGDWQFANRMPYSIGSEAEEGGWDDYYAEINFFKEFPEGPRKDVTFQTSFNGIPWEQSSKGHPYYQKTRGFQVATINSLNAYVLRFADAHLIYAEASNMAEGAPSPAAYESVNKIRRRAAGLPINSADATVDLTGLSSGDFHKAVLAERGWEFAAEWERWWDLVRNQMVAEATAKRDFDNELPLNAMVDVNSEASFEPYYYAPIPLNEMLLRKDWIQNPCCR
ncbi:RagB/SusD family nutrient uptake outer membrane protein [Pontibacter sp. G13]|uniref:RagB/SusD family nutrient uptake outer membrane protein n=1 Tax=Pontibacter sp. G13 TaxID=3074898 RepID=UPI00288B419F|nr:RagB/SusD family nutrient uptake outer membrane protein [Pontibacter sp. G13]WNJ19107.1 RagB/SusD family nutrient uptake outer membrane protein [Pontibacter sp. G13]